MTYLSDSELDELHPGDAFVCDVEIYPDYLLIAFKHIASGRFYIFEANPIQFFDRQRLNWLMWRFLIIGFNLHPFDLPLIKMAIEGHNISEIKHAANLMIQGIRTNELQDLYKFSFYKWNTVDLIEVAPLKASLKAYGARLGAHKLQDLPHDPNDNLGPYAAAEVRDYCLNDLALTELVMRELCPQLALRQSMSEQYGIDLRSKSDAQIAESVISNELARIVGKPPERVDISTVKPFRYQVPDYMQFQTKPLQSILERIADVEFDLSATGRPILPTKLHNMHVSLGQSVYKLGMGGLHSSEEKTVHIAGMDYEIADNDVASYYPMIILNQQLYPKHIGPAFLDVYRSIVERRLEAKRNGDKISADALKITINGSFGKFGSPYSRLFAPELLVQVTLSGQLSLLMLIEALELVGVRVVSANTDGFVSKYKPTQRFILRRIIAEWERITGFTTEETKYSGLYSRDVNNYIAVTTDRNIKAKGAYSIPEGIFRFHKNLEFPIVNKAIHAYLAHNTAIAHTINECHEPLDFTSSRSVRGGAYGPSGAYLGKVVRWYYGLGCTRPILTAQGHKVARTEGATLAMELPFQLDPPPDRQRYIEIANAALADLGIGVRKQRSIFEAMFD